MISTSLESHEILEVDNGIDSGKYSIDLGPSIKKKEWIDSLIRSGGNPISHGKVELMKPSETASESIKDEREILIQHPPQDLFISLQKWEGCVTEVGKDYFSARLIDLTGIAPEEEGEFYYDEISEDDRELVAPGAIFYWNIGYLDTYSGQRKKESIIRFRRMPVWTQKDLEDAKNEAEKIKNKFKQA